MTADETGTWTTLQDVVQNMLDYYIMKNVHVIHESWHYYSHYYVHKLLSIASAE